jgi:hypothetical protein
LLGPAIIADDVNEPAELARAQRDLWHRTTAMTSASA